MHLGILSLYVVLILFIFVVMSLGWSLGRWFVLTLLNLLQQLLDDFIGKSAFVRILFTLWHPQLNSSMLMNRHTLLWRMDLLCSSNITNSNFLLCGYFLCNSFAAVSSSCTIFPSFPTVSHGFPLSWKGVKNFFNFFIYCFIWV